MINKSFQLIRTNPLLTTNLKVVVSSDYSLYLESFNTNSELNNVKYKHYTMYKSELLENKIPSFYNKLPIDLAFDVRYNNDNNIIQNSYEYQFDTIYYAGAGYVEDQWYSEEFDYLAPLYIRKSSLPKAFIILRVDEPSGYNLNTNNYFELDNLNKDNFSEIPDNWKCIKYFDMTYTSNLGEWLYKNYINNDRYPKMAFEYNAEKAEFSNWYGMDYQTGIYTSRPLFMEDRNAIETPHFRFEKFITEGYKRSQLIYPYILNLKFLFDDTPATPNSIRKYSMNRYYGFYAENIDFVSSITSYRTPPMRTDTMLINNIIVLSGNTGSTVDYCNLDYPYDAESINPFIENWDDNKEYYVFIDNTNDFYRTKTISDLYPIQKVEQEGMWIYKVVSDEIMDDYWNSFNPAIYSNIKTVDINYGNFNILSGVSNDFFIDKYIDCDGLSGYTYGDLYLIKIDDNYHVIKYSSNIEYSETEINNKNELITDKNTGDVGYYQYYIQTDYAINLNKEYLEYWIQGKNSPYYRKHMVESPGYRNPLTFPVFRVKFTDIKDFDFDRVNTDYASFDYEKTEYVETTEEKLYAFNYNYNSIPTPKRLEKVGTASQYRVSNVSSEYIADDELYEIYNIGQQSTFTNNSGSQNKLYDLSDIWRKNQSIVKWGFMGSISHVDYPYKLNNNYEVGGAHNRIVDPFLTVPNILSKNLDYFYRIGNFYNSSGYTYYKNQTTNIQYDFISTNIGEGFDLDAYFGKNNSIRFDYFTFFFKNKMYYEDNSLLYTKSYDKYSVFNCGDQYNPSLTLFKGLKIKIKEVKNIYRSSDNLKNTKILYGDKTYNDYKFSIILNENYFNNTSRVINNNQYIDTQTNGINIILNEKYQNVLIIVNANMTGSTTINDVSQYNEKDGLYYGKNKSGVKMTNYNPSLFTASNFINAINDYNNNYGFDYIKYYLIREIDDYIYTGCTNVLFDINSTMKNIPDWNYDFQNFMLNIEYPTSITINNNCYSTVPYYVNNVNDDYVGTMIKFDDSKSFQVPIYRFSGPYEPIFKDINLFKGGYFCYNFTSSGSTLEETTSTLYPGVVVGSGWIGNMCSTDNDYVKYNVSPYTLGVSYQLYINGFNFNIPNDAAITGVTLKITKKASIQPSSDFYVLDSKVVISKNVNGGEESSDQAWNNYSNSDEIWSENLFDSNYPKDSRPTDPPKDYSLWGFSSLTPSEVNSPNFGVVFSATVKNSGSTSQYLPMIKCVSMTIKYKYNKTTYTGIRTVYFDNNYKFDTSLNDFGRIDELIFSKVNENYDILSNSENKYHIYPAIDEFGYEYASRFIFKSPWDKEFFIRTNPKTQEVTYQSTTPAPVINVGAPKVITIRYYDLTENGTVGSVYCEGEVTDMGQTSIIEMGFCYSTNPDPNTSDSTKIFTPIGVTSFTVNIDSLVLNQKYYLKAYAKNLNGTSYGNQIDFTVPGPPFITTQNADGIQPTFAMLHGTITDGGGYSITDFGFYCDTNSNPTTQYTTMSGQPPSYPHTYQYALAGLNPNTLYYVKAYVTNSRSAGTNTAYGSVLDFTTDMSPTPPTVETTSLTLSTLNGIDWTIYAIGNITSIGSSSIINHGFVYDLVSSPTANPTNKGPASGVGTFSDNILISNQNHVTYYVRAFAENGIGGRVYGSDLSIYIPKISTDVQGEVSNSSTPSIKIENAIVTITNSTYGFNQNTTTNNRGEYIIYNVITGSNDISSIHPDYVDYKAIITVAAGSNTENISMTPNP